MKFWRGIKKDESFNNNADNNKTEELRLNIYHKKQRSLNYPSTNKGKNSGVDKYVNYFILIFKILFQ